MIFTFYTSKGGAGKTSAVLSLLSAIAEENAELPEEQRLRVLAVDADRQRSLSRFSVHRNARDFPTYSIEFRSLDLSHSDAPETLAALEDDYDLIVVDLPGFDEDEHVRIAAVSHTVIVPFQLNTDEATIAGEIVNQLVALQQDGWTQTHIVQIITRAVANVGFLTSFSKVLLAHLENQGFPIMKATLTKQAAVENMLNFGMFLFELVHDDPKAKTAKRAAEDARQFLAELSALGSSAQQEETAKEAVAS